MQLSVNYLIDLNCSCSLVWWCVPLPNWPIECITRGICLWSPIALFLHGRQLPIKWRCTDLRIIMLCPRGSSSILTDCSFFYSFICFFICLPQAPPPAGDRCLWSISHILLRTYRIRKLIFVLLLTVIWLLFWASLCFLCVVWVNGAKMTLCCAAWHRRSQQKTSLPLLATAFLSLPESGSAKLVYVWIVAKRKDINLKWQASKHSY